jgi:hypothetical protein
MAKASKRRRESYTTSILLSVRERLLPAGLQQRSCHRGGGSSLTEPDNAVKRTVLFQDGGYVIEPSV